MIDLLERYPQRFVNVKSAAGIVGKSANTIRRWIAEKRIKAYKVGGTLVVDRDSLRWIIRDPSEADTAPALTSRDRDRHAAASELLKGTHGPQTT